jgi:thioredoxin 1
MQRFFSTRGSQFASSVVASSQLVASQRLAVESFNGTHDEFKTKVATGTAVVDFYTTWCQPCKAAAPVFAELSDKHASFKFLKIDVEENEEVGAMMNVRSIPFFVLFKDGKVVGSVEGANMAKLTQLVDDAAK